MVLIHAFTNQWGTNISRRTFSDLQKLITKSSDSYSHFQGESPKGKSFVFQLIHFHPRAFFQKYIRNDNYDLIIGLGDGSDKCHKTRIETIATNRYGYDPIYDLSPFKLELSMPTLDLVDPDKFDISEFMGTYNCNWIAYSIQLHLNSLHSTGIAHHTPHQLFFHLPKRANSSQLASHIFDLLKNNQII